ncbi:hypothetical protein KEM48_006016 [Puccinia striiformis f. sp. tritici PST-130]|nr:hypothetical protein KEM48_006016 [Puccinia striiformis f. sp. tritici PST-130]
MSLEGCWRLCLRDPDTLRSRQASCHKSNSLSARCHERQTQTRKLDLSNDRQGKAIVLWRTHEQIHTGGRTLDRILPPSAKTKYLHSVICQRGPCWQTRPDGLLQPTEKGLWHSVAEMSDDSYIFKTELLAVLADWPLVTRKWQHMELHCPARVQTGTIAEGKPPSYVLARAGGGLQGSTNETRAQFLRVIGPLIFIAPSSAPLRLHINTFVDRNTQTMHISTLLSCLLAVLVQVQAGTPPAPASAPAPLSPRKFPCPLRLYGECAYAVKKPKSGTKHPLVGEQVTLLDATEDEHNPGTWACPAKDIGIAEPSCCESQKNGFHMAREIWLKECPPNQTK